jgi:hypothetical protein
MMAASILISTLWVAVHVIEILVDKARREESREPRKLCQYPPTLSFHRGLDAQRTRLSLTRAANVT